MERNTVGSGKNRDGRSRKAGGGLWFSIVRIDQIKRAFRELPRTAAKKVIRKAMRPAMKLVAARVAALVPVDSGLTQRSIRVRAAKRSRTGFGLNVQVGEGDYVGDTYYAAFLEYGTIKNPPVRFMLHAYLQRGGAAKRMCERLLGDLITDEVRRLRAA